MRKLPKLCVLAASPLTIHFFLKQHIKKLSEYFDVTLVYNPYVDSYVLPLNLPAREIPLCIQRKMAPLTDVVTLMQLIRVLKREQFDLVVSVVPKAGLLGMLAAVVTGVRHRVHIFQGQVWASANGFKRWLLKTMDTITATCATSLLAVSYSERRFLEEQGVTPADKTIVLGHGSISGVNLYRFRPNAAFRDSIRKKYGVPYDAIVCLFLGRLSVDKGVRELVAAFDSSARKSENLWLMLVGPDEESEVRLLKQSVDPDLSSRLIIEDFTTVPEQYLAAADFLCLPSYREGFGMVAVEAAATAIPTIGSDIYGISDAIEDQITGLLVPVRDSAALADAMSQLMASTEERLALGRAGRLRVETEFEQNQVVDRYVEFFRALVSDEATI